MNDFSIFLLYFPLLLLLGSTWYNLLRGVLEVVGGMVAGILLGFLIQYFPSADQVGSTTLTVHAVCLIILIMLDTSCETIREEPNCHTLGLIMRTAIAMCIMLSP